MPERVTVHLARSIVPPRNANIQRRRQQTLNQQIQEHILPLTEYTIPMAASKEAAEALVPKFKFERLLNQGIAEELPSHFLTLFGS